MLMTPDDVEQWLRGGTVEDALKMQKPAPDDAIVIRPEERKRHSAYASILLASAGAVLRRHSHGGWQRCP